MPHNKYISAFAHRRAITVTQVLSLDDPVEGIHALAKAWAIPIKEDFIETLGLVAQHAILYDRQYREIEKE